MSPKISKSVNRKWHLVGLCLVISLGVWLYHESLYRRINLKINFYGLVIDEEGNPVPGVTVQARTYYFNLLLGYAIIDRSAVYPAKTDNAGRFQFSGMRGSLSIEVLKKDGYVTSEHQIRSFRFDLPEPHQTDIDHPEIFRVLSRKLVAEKLVRHHPRRKLKTDGTAFYFNPLDSNDSNRPENGRFQIGLTRTVVLLPGGLSLGFQSVKIKPIRALVRMAPDTTRDPVLRFAAPLDGYVEELSMFSVFAKTNWHREETFTFFYYLLEEYRYGVASVCFGTGLARPVNISIDAVTNPTGNNAVSELRIYSDVWGNRFEIAE